MICQWAAESPAEWSDVAAGVTHRAGFWISPGSDRLFGALTLPAEPVGAVVLCPSVGTDVIANHRRELALARALAGYGIGVCRFQFRGTGNSGGDDEGLSLDGMVRDAAIALERLLASVPHGVPVGLGGVRWGAAPALMLSARLGTAPTLLWDPILHPVEFFRDGHRIDKTRDLLTGRTNTSVFDQFQHGLGRQTVRVMGQRYPAGLVRGVAEFAGRPRAGGPLRVVSFPNGPAADDTAQVLSGLSGTGVAVTHDASAESGNWWLIEGRHGYDGVMVQRSAQWLAGQMSEGAA